MVLVVLFQKESCLLMAGNFLYFTGYYIVSYPNFLLATIR